MNENRSDVSVTNCSEKTPPPESQLRQRLENEGLDPYRWSNAAGYQYSAHTHSYRKILYVTDGSITFKFPERPDLEEAQLQAGDRMDLAAGISHSATVGTNGVTCLEAHRDSGNTSYT